MVVETDPFVSSHHRPWISTMTVGVRGTLTKFKRRRGVAKSVNVPRFKIGQKSLDCHIPMPSFTTGGPARQAFGGPDQRHRARRGNPRRTPENPRSLRARAESVARRREYG